MAKKKRTTRGKRSATKPTPKQQAQVTVRAQKRSKWTWKKILLIVALMLVAIVAIPFLLGSQIPEEKTLVLEHRFDGIREQTMWDILYDIEGSVQWSSTTESITMLAQEREGYNHWKEVQRGQEIELQTIEQEHLKYMVVKIVNGEELGFEGTWRFDIRKFPGGVTLVITEHSRISNPAFRFFAQFMSSEQLIHTLFEDLEKEFARRGY